MELSEEKVKPSVDTETQDMYVKVDTLKPSLRNMNVTVKVVSKSPTKNVTSRRDFTINSVAEALVGDETGCVILTRWDKKVDEFDEGDVIDVRNGYTSLFRGFLRLNIGRYGTAEKVKTEMGEVNTKNNLSEKKYNTLWYTPTSRSFRRQRNNN